MRSRLDRKYVDDLRSQEYITEAISFDMEQLGTDEEFVLRSIAELAKSDFGVLHQPPDEVQRLYLITGEVFLLGDSGVTRLS
jgi:hypothetical protein